MSLSRTYLENAEKMISEKEYSKAGEMLWGAIATLLKAIGIMYSKPIRNHRELIEIAKYIALVENDEELRKAIVQYAQALHANYYEEFIDMDEFPKYQIEVMKAYDKLFQLIIHSPKDIETATKQIFD